MDHLIAASKNAVTFPLEERIAYLKRPKWIGYDRAKEILNKLEDIFNRPKSPRMPNLLIIGETNNGKTSIIHRFYEMHPASDRPEDDNIWLPILSMQAPPTPDESSFYDEILYKMATPIRRSDHPRNKRFQVIQILKRIGTKMLIIDEIQHLVAGDLRKQQSLLNSIKFIGNELQIPIVAVGVHEAFNAFQIDRQLSNRFTPLPIPKWKMDDNFRSLLMSFEKILPLKEASNLVSSKIAQRILSLSEGTIGEISEILIQATEYAIRDKKEKIDLKIIDSINWIPPSETKRKALSVI